MGRLSLFRNILNNFFFRYLPTKLAFAMPNSKEHIRIRLAKLLFVAIAFMAVGVVLELYLIGHFEDVFQLVPIITIALSFFIGIALWSKPLVNRVRLFKFSLLLCTISGFLGVFLHIKANYEFEKEMNTKASVTQLLIDSMSGAFPALAPGSMILFALIGYSYLLIVKSKNEVTH